MARPTSARCGTDSGYYRHRNQGDLPACGKCRDAHAAAERARVAGRRKPIRYCMACGGQTRTKHATCYQCRRILGQRPGLDPARFPPDALEAVSEDVAGVARQVAS
jgi:hypothetical protein